MSNRVESVEVPLAVAIGGAIGAVARWGLASAIVSDLPIATFITNLLGCFALGVVLVAGEVVGRHGGHPHHHQKWWVRVWRPFLATGVLGGFTTFSTLVVELNHLAVPVALAYLVGSVVLGIAAYSAGNNGARALWSVST